MLIQIFLNVTVWDTMAQCSFEDYHGTVRPDHCDYQWATCVVNGGVHVSCRVRRKGTTTWRDMENKPSLKLKFSEAVTFGENWVSKKLTLNNGVLSVHPMDEVNAYDVFRKLGNVAPMASRSTVELYRGSVPIVNTYTMIETINDKAFMNKHYEEPWCLWEVERGAVEFERGEDSCEGMDLFNISFANTTNLFQYFAGERLSSHWDGMCLLSGELYPNNVYVAMSLSSGNISFIPSGVDQTMQCHWLAKKGIPTCSWMLECLEDTKCARDYRHFWINSGAQEELAKQCPVVDYTLLIVMLVLVCCVVSLCMLCASLRRCRMHRGNIYVQP